MEEELFLREDIHELCANLLVQNRNVRAYQRRNLHSHRSKQRAILSRDLPEEETEKNYSAERQVKTVLSSKRFSSTGASKRRKPRSDGLSKAFIKTAMQKQGSFVQESTQIQSPSIAKRILRTANAMERGNTVGNLLSMDDRSKSIRANIATITISHTAANTIQTLQHTPDDHILAIDQEVGTFSKTIQAGRRSKKGKVAERHLQNWLNQAITQYCHQQKFSQSIPNAAVKKFGMDRNSLTTKGISAQNVTRIYKALYVYSIGFNELLGQICGGSCNATRKTIWKVFAILLQYCAEGTFETMIGEIERDRARQMAALEDQLVKKQAMIDNYEEINEAKNAKVFKELKLLKEKNAHLEDQKLILLDDFKETEQAFNEEVALRLKFQGKINEIHGVHRELCIKHERLFKDLQMQRGLTASFSDQLASTQAAHTLLKGEYNHLQEALKCVVQEGENLAMGHEALRYKLEQAGRDSIEDKREQRQLQDSLDEKQRRMEFVRDVQANAERLVDKQNESFRELEKEYFRSLEENKLLNESLQKSIQTTNGLLADKNKFHNDHLSLYGQIDLLKRTAESANSSIGALKAKLASAQELMLGKDTEIKEGQFAIANLESSLNDCYCQIAQMKRVKEEAQEFIRIYSKKEDSIAKQCADRDARIKELSDKLEKKEKQFEQLCTEKQSLQSAMDILKEKLVSEGEISKRKADKLKEQIQNISSLLKIMSVGLAAKEQQAMNCMGLYEQCNSKLRNQLFQRNDIELKYKHSLSMLESQSEFIKDLNRKISDYVVRELDLERKIATLEFQRDQKERASALEIECLQKGVKAREIELHQSKLRVHPLILEDALSSLYRQTEAKKEISQTANTLKEQLEVIRYQHGRQMNELSTRGGAVQERLERLLQKKGFEVEYEKEKILKYLRQIDELEMLVETYKAGRQPLPANEKKYQQLLKEKNQQVTDLLTEVERIHDHNNRLLKRIQSAEAQVADNNSKFAVLQRELEAVDKEKQAIEAERITLSRREKEMVSRLERESQLGQSSRRKDASVQKSVQIRERRGMKGSEMGRKIQNAYHYYGK